MNQDFNHKEQPNTANVSANKKTEQTPDLHQIPDLTDFSDIFEALPEDDADKTPDADSVEKSADTAQDIAWNFPSPQPEETSADNQSIRFDLFEDDEADNAADSVQSTGDTAPGQDNSERYRAKTRKKRRALAVIIPCAFVLCMLLGYLTVVFAPIPFVRKWRDIYIETAMTTGDHQWLATAIIPGYIINEVMNVETDQTIIGGIGNLTHDTAEPDDPTHPLVPDNDPAVTDDNPSGEHPHVPDPPKQETDILKLNTLEVGKKDYAGNKVLLIDKEEGLYVAEISTLSYKGRVMLIDDPSRIFVGTTPEKKTRGYRIREMANYYGGIIAGINASGFNDPNDSGDGKDIIGFCMSEGAAWGYYTSSMASIVLTKDNHLAVGYISDWSSWNIRDGMQFGPVLIADGEQIVDSKSTAGYGIHPRTAIGQREDGVIILLVIDGRDPLYSIGCTVGDLSGIMASYGAVNAGCCDGGSSCVLMYNDEVLNHNSSANPTYGRRLPNAFLVRSKKTEE